MGSMTFRGQCAVSKEIHPTGIAASATRSSQCHRSGDIAAGSTVETLSTPVVRLTGTEVLKLYRRMICPFELVATVCLVKTNPAGIRKSRVLVRTG